MCVKTARSVNKMKAANPSSAVFRLLSSGHRSTQHALSLPKLKKFGRPFKQSLFAFSINIFGLIAGTLVALYFGLFSKAPWVIFLYPAILSLRGVVGGLLCGRLSTGLHLGLIEPKFLGNTKAFYLLVEALLVLTSITSFCTGVLAFLLVFLFWNVSLSVFLTVLSIVIATMTLSLLLISPLTMGVSFLSFKKGLDPDIVLYPVQSTTADILVTACYILVLTLFFSHGFAGTLFIGVLCVALFLFAAYFSFRNRFEADFVKTVREALPTLISVSFIVNVTGLFLGKISQMIGDKPEIYVVYPALIDTIGDVGAVVGSTATTKLALGTLAPSIFDAKDHINEILGAWLASLIMFFLYSFLSSVAKGILAFRSFFSLLTVLVATNVIAAFSMIAISFAIGILTFQKGLDPDNFVIPIESSLADTITTLALLIVLTVTG